MKLCSAVVLALALASAAVAAPPSDAQDLRKIKKVVLFMQENRAFDHYFGTMAGVRGFQDPNVHISKNTGKSVFHQPVDQTIKTDTPPSSVQELKPWYLGWQGGDWTDRMQCMVAGTNDWRQNHAAWNKGEIDQWAIANTPYSIGYVRDEDIPVQWKLAESFTVGDMYYESVISSTDPNRVSWFSGTVNPPKGSQINGTNVDMGGPVLDNNETPGCENADNGSKFSCMPLKWKTVPEYLQDAGISWQVYQDLDNFGDDPLVYFTQYQDSARKKGELAQRGTSFPGLKKFYEDARNGNLPDVSYIVAPMELSEHPPYMPMDGGWIQGKVAEAVMNGKDWDSTALIYSFDETGGWGDHVMSPHPPQTVESEWIIDPYNETLGNAPIGPGFRLPFYIVSPWTRGGHVFTEHSSHESQIMFLEEWAKAHGKPFHTHAITPWRRAQMSNLVSAFDFSKSDTSVPYLPRVRKPSQDIFTGNYNGADVCQAKYLDLVQPKVPYGHTDSAYTMEVHKGFKKMRGNMTEGRKFTMEANGRAVSHSSSPLVSTKSRKQHDGEDQLFVVHWIGEAPKDNRFHISTTDNKYLTKSLHLNSSPHHAAEFALIDMGNGAGYRVVEAHTQRRLTVSKDGKVSLEDGDATVHLFSVTM